VRDFSVPDGREPTYDQARRAAWDAIPGMEIDERIIAVWFIGEAAVASPRRNAATRETMG